jgi:hypothetical protein
MSAEPASFFALDHWAQMGGSGGPLVYAEQEIPRRNPMLQAQIIRSSTFQWALAVAGVFAIFVIVLFGFIHWQTDEYLIARSDRVIALQLDGMAALPGERRQDAIDERLRQDSRGVQYAGLFGPDGHKIAGCGRLEIICPDSQGA